MLSTMICTMALSLPVAGQSYTGDVGVDPRQDSITTEHKYIDPDELKELKLLDWEHWVRKFREEPWFPSNVSWRELSVGDIRDWLGRVRR